MVRRSSRLALAAGALEAWGFRPPSARAAQQDYDPTSKGFLNDEILSTR